MVSSNGTCGTNVFHELDRSLNRLVRNVLQPDQVSGAAPGMSLTEFEDRYVVELDLPGVSAEEVSVEVENGVLSVTGQRVAPERAEGTSVLMDERAYGKFSRRIQLAGDARAENVDAEYRDGVLTIHVPRQPKPAPQKVKIRTQQS